MSSIAITGGATGTGVFSLLAPSTSTNRTLTLPDSAGTVATAESTLVQFNASGSAPVYACRAWVNFNGTGTVAIRASGNVSSITDGGVGLYTVNFTTAMPDANYSVTLAGRWQSGVDASGAWAVVNTNGTSNITTTAVSILTANTSGSLADSPFIGVSIFR